MKSPLHKFILFVISSSLATLTVQAQAQLVNLPGAQNPSLTDVNGDYQLSGAQVSLDASGLPPALNTSLNPSAGAAGPTGWAFSSSQGETWVANLDLGDPKVAYSIAFENTTSTTQLYNVSFSVPITPAQSYNPANVRGTVSGTLLNGGSDPNTPAVLTPALGSTTGGSGTFLQTSTLTLASGGTNSTNVDLTPGIVTAPGDGGNVTFQAQTLSYNLYNPNGPTGTYNALNVQLSFYLTPGDYATFTGRVDVIGSDATQDVPEPSAVMLLLIGLGALSVLIRTRKNRAA